MRYAIKKEVKIKKIIKKNIWNFTWLVIRPVLIFFCRFEVRGKENLLNLKKPFIIAAAIHTNYADPFIAAAAFPFNSDFFPIRYMIKARIFDKPVLKWILKVYGGFRVEYNIGIKNSLREAISLAGNGEVVGIFVEGGISINGEFNGAKPGAAYLALKTGIPVLPLALSGTFRLNFLNLFFRRNKVAVSFGQPIFANISKLPYNNNNNLTKEENVEFLRKIIENELRKLLYEYKTKNFNNRR